MVKKTKAVDSAILAEIIVKGMQEKKGNDIVVMDLREVKSAVADFFVVCHADSDRQVEAIARSVEDEADKGANENVWHREGYENAEWILLDYINVVAHVFQTDKRDFFGIEELWGDAKITRY